MSMSTCGMLPSSLLTVGDLAVALAEHAEEMLVSFGLGKFGGAGEHEAVAHGRCEREVLLVATGGLHRMRFFLALFFGVPPPCDRQTDACWRWRFRSAF
jgi:hypothetical protein